MRLEVILRARIGSPVPVCVKQDFSSSQSWMIELYLLTITNLQQRTWPM